MTQRMLTNQEITEIAGTVVSKIEETGSVFNAMNDLTVGGAPKVTLTTMSAVTTLISLIPAATNNLPIAMPLAKVAQAFAAGAVGQEAADGTYTWKDVAALSTAIASTLATIPEPTGATKIAAALLLE